MRLGEMRNQPVTNMAGKGDKPRPTDLNKFGKNYDEINWGDDKITPKHEILPMNEPEGVIFYPDGWFKKIENK